MSVTIKYFVHGTTIDNEEGKATGWSHGKLSQKGIEQAKELRKKINLDEIDLVITSDLERAKESANYIFKKEKEILNDSRIRECCYGKLDEEDKILVNYEEHIIEPFPQGETLKDVEYRVEEFCKYLLEKYDGKTVALVSHRAPQLALEVITKGITWEEAIQNDWRNNKAWQPGWTYIINK